MWLALSGGFLPRITESGMLYVLSSYLHITFYFPVTCASFSLGYIWSLIKAEVFVWSVNYETKISCWWVGLLESLYIFVSILVWLLAFLCIVFSLDRTIGSSYPYLNQVLLQHVGLREKLHNLLLASMYSI